MAELLASLDAYPAYYARMGPGNAAGPAAPDLSLPHQAGPAELRRRLAAGEWLVDLRSRRVFAAGHLAGSLGFELGDTLAPQLGWLLPAGTTVTLLGETAGQVAAAQRELARVGINRPAAIATGKAEEWAAGEPLASFPVADFAALAAARRKRPVTVLDVRRDLDAGRPYGRRRGHPAARAARAAGRDPRRRAVGALPGRLPGGRGGFPAAGRAA